MKLFTQDSSISEKNYKLQMMIENGYH